MIKIKHLGKFLESFTLRKLNLGPGPDAPQAATIADANVVTSTAANEFGDVQYPVLDLDVPTLLLESTNGGGHLLIRHPLTSAQYGKLLEVLHEVGLLQEGNLSRWRENGFTAVRLPWIVKGVNEIGSGAPNAPVPTSPEVTV